MVYYTETDYPEKTFTIDEANVRESGGACPFQAEGSIAGEFFYFRLRNGYASLEVGSHFSNGTSVNTSEYGYLDGACSYDEFEQIFNDLIETYVPEKTPVSYPGSYGTLSYSDATVLTASDHLITGEIDDDFFSLEISGGIVTLEIGDYERMIRLSYGEYDDMYSAFEEKHIEGVFNRLIADYV